MPIELIIFIENVLNGLTLGAFYAMVTIGLALIFGVVRLVNFAHGDFFMVGGYFLFFFMTMLGVSLPYLVLVPLVTLATAAFAVGVERIVISPIVERSWRVHAVATLGISIILQNLALIFFTSDPKQTPSPFSSQIIDILGVRISMQRIIILVVVIIVFFVLHWFIKHTKTGKAMRAVSQNREMCQIVGIDIRRISIITFAISGALAGLAAVLVAPLLSVRPEMGALITLKCLAAVILGGLGHLNGAIVAAFLLGIIESLFGGYVSFMYRDVVSFGIFILVLLLRPQGLFGRKVGL